MKCGGINLWNLPRQPDYEWHIRVMQRIKETADKSIAKDAKSLHLKQVRARRLENIIKDINFIHYTRTGRFVE